jgi:hypothetical protein
MDRGHFQELTSEFSLSQEELKHLDVGTLDLAMGELNRMVGSWEMLE